MRACVPRGLEVVSAAVASVAFSSVTSVCTARFPLSRYSSLHLPASLPPLSSRSVSMCACVRVHMCSVRWSSPAARAIEIQEPNQKILDGDALANNTFGNESGWIVVGSLRFFRVVSEVIRGCPGKSPHSRQSRRACVRACVPRALELDMHVCVCARVCVISR